MQTATELAASKEQTAIEKAAHDKTIADAKAVKEAHDKELKRLADERVNIKAHLIDILLLRGLARSFSPHGAEDIAGALDSIANALVSGKKLDENLMVELVIALKNYPNDWTAMVKKINDLMRPILLPDRTPFGILRAVQSGEVTLEQGNELMNHATGPGGERASHPASHPLSHAADKGK